MDDILGFRGRYKFLSNFFPVQINYEDITYPSVEHAYQASKTTNINERLLISELPTAQKAKQYGQVIKLRENWNDIKIDIMYELLKIKFQNTELKMQLIQTKDKYIEETNTWGDRFWGVCGTIGKNHLGQLLMKVRAELLWNQALGK